MKKTLILWLDALGYHKINPITTPFLYQLTQKDGLGKHQTPFGFSNIPAAFYTGKKASETNSFCLYWMEKRLGNQIISLFPTQMADKIYEGMKKDKIYVKAPFMVKLVPLMKAISRQESLERAAELSGVTSAMDNYTGREKPPAGK